MEDVQRSRQGKIRRSSRSQTKSIKHNIRIRRSRDDIEKREEKMKTEIKMKMMWMMEMVNGEATHSQRRATTKSSAAFEEN